MRPSRQAHGARSDIDALHDRKMALAERTITTEPAEPSEYARHSARHFSRLPDGEQAAALLAGMATSPCAFAPPGTGRPLALYGAGNLGRLARDFVRAVGREVVMVVDRNAGTVGKEPAWSGLPVYRPDEVNERDRHELMLAISVATSPYVPLERSLRQAGFQHIAPFYDWAENFRGRHPLSNGWFAPPFSPEDEENTRKVLATWGDDLSRAHHLQFLAWRRLREEWTFDPARVQGGNRFFIPEVTRSLGRHEVLLDAGAHHGSVARAFMERTDNAFRQIVAVEPDPANRAVLAAALPNRACIDLLDCALGEHPGEAQFHDGLDYASQIAPTGRRTVTVRPVDTLGVAPTLFKLHLEGHEFPALKGARNTLLAHRPIVAATVYHNADGIWRTALWLMQTLPRYRFLFRTHSWCGTGAVVYAIPTERTT